MAYIDGFVIPVPADKRQAYLDAAAKAAPLFREFGALEIVECWGDDVPHGKVTDFYMSVNATETENVVFSWVVWPSREARDKGNKMIMADERMKAPDPMPFDPRRMIFGGFQTLLDEGKK